MVCSRSQRLMGSDLVLKKREAKEAGAADDE